jgi:cyclic beta-1,2-glucan synthetase
MYRAGIEGILGIRREGDFLIVDPCIPSKWPGFEATVRVDSTRFDIRVDNSVQRGPGSWSAIMDGEPLHRITPELRVPLDGRRHILALAQG